MTVKINLRPLREQRGLSQEALGAAVGVGQTAIANIESGRSKPSIEMALKLASYLDVPLDHLVAVLDGSEPEPEAACA